MAQQRVKTAMAVSTIIRRKGDDVRRQALLVGIVPRWVTLRRAVPAEQLADPPLRNRQQAAYLLDRLTATGGA
jgi:hypothetical protein